MADEEDDAHEGHTDEDLEVMAHIHSIVDHQLLGRLAVVISDNNETHRSSVTIASNVATLAYLITACLHDSGAANVEDAESVAASLGNYIHYMTLRQFDHAAHLEDEANDRGSEDGQDDY